MEEASEGRVWQDTLIPLYGVTKQRKTKIKDTQDGGWQWCLVWDRKVGAQKKIELGMEGDRIKLLEKML